MAVMIGLKTSDQRIVTDPYRSSLRGGKPRACPLKRFGAQAWQTSEIASPRTEPHAVRRFVPNDTQGLFLSQVLKPRRFQRVPR